MRAYLRHLVAFIFLVLFGLAVVGVSSSPVAAAPFESRNASSVVAQACDPSGSVNGTAEPSTVRPGETITFTVRNFRVGEEVSFWFTRPDGAVAGTARPLCCAPSSTFRFAPERIPEEFGAYPGRWAFTVQGAQSQNQAIVYFCIVTQAQPTATPVPPTATPAPPTATTAPPTATTAPPTATTVATTPTAVETTPTSVATTPTVPAASPTTVVTTPTAVAPTPTTVVETPTAVVPTPTEIVVEEPTPVAEATPTVVGMPRTGAPEQNNLMLFVLLAFVAAGLLSTGWFAHRTARVKR